MTESGRVKFQQKKTEIINGRKSESWSDWYSCWAAFPAASLKEQTDIHNQQLNEALTIEVRSCQKTEHMRQDMKRYRVIYRGVEYDLKSADYSRQHAGHIRLLASRCD